MTIAIYLRLSLEDDDLNVQKRESNSITSQRLLLQNYIATHDEWKSHSVVEFCDDGYTGTNFDRPQFQAMIQQAKDGNIQCIMVKDLSRFGRNYLEVGDYLEHIFPFLGLRFLAINDGYDSNDYSGTTSGLDVAFRNLLHQKYSQDLSEKVKSAMHMKIKQGRYVTHPPFGYAKSQEDKHTMVPHPQTAPIVQEIFQNILAGHSTTEVAVMLNEKGIPTPMAWKQWKTKESMAGSRRIWEHRMILRIIKDVKYTGTMVGHKCESRHIRDTCQRRVPKEEWVVRENMHPALVSKEDFQRANQAIGTVAPATKNLGDGKDRVYYCGHCGRKLQKSVNQKSYFSCVTPKYHPDSGCIPFRLEQSELESVLLASFRGQLLLLEEQAKALAPKLPAPNYHEQLRQVEKSISHLNSEKLGRYEAYRDGQLGKEEFLHIKANLLQKIDALEVEKKDLLQQQQAERETTNAPKQGRMLPLNLTNQQLKSWLFDNVARVLVYSERSLNIQWKFEDMFDF